MLKNTFSQHMLWMFNETMIGEHIIESSMERLRTDELGRALHKIGRPNHHGWQNGYCRRFFREFLRLVKFCESYCFAVTISDNYRMKTHNIAR